MTDRAEIERLLNQTGRTLEGLPNDIGYLCSAEYLYDLVDLMIGALRDALEKLKNRPFSKEEIEDSIYVIPCVIEEKKFGLMKSDILKCSQIDKKYYGMYEALTSVVSRSKYDIKDYGKTWRCWASRPTDEEREAAAWES